MSVYAFKASHITGQERDLADYKDKVLLIVNTASKCGFTSQFEGLETMYKELHDQGFEVLGFPCNQFAQQDKGSDSEIADFCLENYGVSFPMFSKIEVNGDNAHPLYQYLKKEARGILGTQKVKWNFTKFLVNQKGEVVKRFAPTAKPDTIAKHVRQLLAQ